MKHYTVCLKNKMVPCPRVGGVVLPLQFSYGALELCPFVSTCERELGWG
jgi:hypothetical protein